MAAGEDHKYSSDDDRCTCGGIVVWFEHDPKMGRRVLGVTYGEGCEVAGRPWGRKITRRRRPSTPAVLYD